MKKIILFVAFILLGFTLHVEIENHKHQIKINHRAVNINRHSQQIQNKTDSLNSVTLSSHADLIDNQLSLLEENYNRVTTLKDI